MQRFRMPYPSHLVLPDWTSVERKSRRIAFRSRLKLALILPMNRSAHMRIFRWFTAACCCFAALTSAHSGYLAKVGPSPLRFQPPPTVARTLLPPLPKDTLLSPVGVMPPPVIATNETITVASGVATNETPEMIVTPQMIVQSYQNHPGHRNSPETDVVLSPSFVPPTPAGKPSSSATYESP
jgi:hypothetical protein